MAYEVTINISILDAAGDYDSLTIRVYSKAATVLKEIKNENLNDSILEEECRRVFKKYLEIIMLLPHELAKERLEYERLQINLKLLDLL